MGLREKANVLGAVLAYAIYITIILIFIVRLMKRPALEHGLGLGLMIAAVPLVYLTGRRAVLPAAGHLLHTDRPDAGVPPRRIPSRLRPEDRLPEHPLDDHRLCHGLFFRDRRDDRRGLPSRPRLGDPRDRSVSGDGRPRIHPAGRHRDVRASRSKPRQAVSRRDYHGGSMDCRTRVGRMEFRRRIRECPCLRGSGGRGPGDGDQERPRLRRRKDPRRRRPSSSPGTRSRRSGPSAFPSGPRSSTGRGKRSSPGSSMPMSISGMKAACGRPPSSG